MGRASIRKQAQCKFASHDNVVIFVPPLVAAHYHHNTGQSIDDWAYKYGEIVLPKNAWHFRTVFGKKVRNKTSLNVEHINNGMLWSQRSLGLFTGWAKLAHSHYFALDYHHLLSVEKIRDFVRDLCSELEEAGISNPEKCIGLFDPFDLTGWPKMAPYAYFGEVYFEAISLKAFFLRHYRWMESEKEAKNRLYFPEKWTDLPDQEEGSYWDDYFRGKKTDSIGARELFCLKAFYQNPFQAQTETEKIILTCKLHTPADFIQEMKKQAA
jgi:hypothetical protein